MDGLEGRILRDGCEGVKEYFTDSHDDHKETPVFGFSSLFA